MRRVLEIISDWIGRTFIRKSETDYGSSLSPGERARVRADNNTNQFFPAAFDSLASKHG